MRLSLSLALSLSLCVCVCGISKWIDRLKKVGMLGQVCAEQVLVPLGVYTSSAHSLVGLVWDWMAGGSLDSTLHDVSTYLNTALHLKDHFTHRQVCIKIPDESVF